MKRALVAGAGGFIGGHLVKRLLNEGYQVRGVDWKPYSEWHQRPSLTNTNFAGRDLCDLKDLGNCMHMARDMDEMYNLAADMGGMGFIESHKLDCMLSVLINTHLLQAAVAMGATKYFYSSSACIYPGYLQGSEGEDFRDYGNKGLREFDAYPAEPEDGYGWEKLFSERMCRHFYEEKGLEVRVARYHNVYGPQGTWDGGREKAPAALCRKVAQAALTGRRDLDIWGNGEQLRSFMFIDDCIEGTRRLMESNWTDPINLGSSEMVSVNDLASRIEHIANHEAGTATSPVRRLPHPLQRVYDLSAPKGVDGRNSDNTMIQKVLRWEPQTTLTQGLTLTYNWVYEQYAASLL